MKTNWKYSNILNRRLENQVILDLKVESCVQRTTLEMVTSETLPPAQEKLSEGIAYDI